MKLLLGSIDRAWVKAREARKIAEEDAVFQAARDRACTEADRAFWDAVIAERARNGCTSSDANESDAS